MNRYIAIAVTALNSLLGTAKIASLAVLLCTVSLAQADEAAKSSDVLNLDASVQAEVVPDLAYIVLAVEREGTDSAAMSEDVNRVLARAFAEAKTLSAVQASSGGYATSARYGKDGVRTGWQIHAEIILKSRDFGVLGKLAGKLSDSLLLTRNGFEISPELRSSEEEQLVQRGIAAFRAKAQVAAKAFGFEHYTIREVSVGAAGQNMQEAPRMLMMAKSSFSSATPVQVEAGRSTLTLTVNGSVQMQR